MSLHLACIDCRITFRTIEEAHDHTRRVMGALGFNIDSPEDAKEFVAVVDGGHYGFYVTDEG